MERRQVFIKELKEKYTELYEANKDIPYVADKLVGAHKVFVGPGIQVLQQSWKQLPSYHNVFRIQKKKLILQGPQGSGKSTLSLQYTYDWCNSVQQSYLKDVDIVIFLLCRQLDREESIYRAIKRFILPEDSNFTENDIKTIMEVSPSVVVILDGLEDINDKFGQHVMKIIMTPELKQFKVIVTTTYLPQNYIPGTIQLRLSAFNEKLQSEYIRQAVVENDKTKVKEIWQKNPVLRNLCEIPFFLVMFAHMIHEAKTSDNFMKITSCFRFIMACLHSHMRKKVEDGKEKKNFVPETDHRELDKVAFDGLRQNKIVWRKDLLLKIVGKECYEHYRGLGVLVEEDVHGGCDESDTTSNQWIATSSFTETQTEVKFHHRIFCEWFAAHYLSKLPIGSTQSEFEKSLLNMNVANSPYLYRFACGLNPKSTDAILKCILNKKGGIKVATMCILEKEDEEDSVLRSVKRLCKRDITLTCNMDKLLERSTVDVLGIARKQGISVSCLVLASCFRSLDYSAGNLQLQSDILLPAMDTLLRLVVTENSRSFSDQETKEILVYSALCKSLKWLKFNNCFLPQEISVDLLHILESRKVNVWWRPPGFVNFKFRLSLKSGKWKDIDSGKIITNEEYETVTARETLRHTS